MESLATTRLSSKGQVVILKTIAPPAMSECDELLRKARGGARKARMKPADVKRAVLKVRTSR
jgi:hypothetical protein